MHLSSVIIGACLLAIGANADPVKGTIFYGKCDKQTNMCVMINSLRPDTNWSLPCKYLCHEDGADCWYATDRTVSGVRWPPSTDMVSCSNNNMPQGDRRPLHFPDPEKFRDYFQPIDVEKLRPVFKPFENFSDFRADEPWSFRLEACDGVDGSGGVFGAVLEEEWRGAIGADS